MMGSNDQCPGIEAYQTCKEGISEINVMVKDYEGASLPAQKGGVFIRAVKAAIENSYDQNLRTICYMESNAFCMYTAGDDARE